jgi:hypothetical protein
MYCGGSVYILFQTCPHCGRHTRFNPAIEAGTLEAYRADLWWRHPELAPPEYFPPGNARPAGAPPAYRLSVDMGDFTVTLDGRTAQVSEAIAFYFDALLRARRERLGGWISYGEIREGCGALESNGSRFLEKLQESYPDLRALVETNQRRGNRLAP